VLTSQVPLFQLFMSPSEISSALETAHSPAAKHDQTPASMDAKNLPAKPASSPASDSEHEGHGIDDVARLMMDDLGLSMTMMKNSSMFTGEEEAFAFSRALSRLSEMGSVEWVERGLGLEKKGGREEMREWRRVRSKWREDSM
jgi:hypothetical protein